MANMEKVIKGLECCRSIDDNCEKCPYNYEGEHGENECLRGQLMSDILELLQEQEAETEWCDRCGRVRLKSKWEGR